MRNFRAEKTLQRISYSFIANQLLSKKEKEYISTVFKSFDTDGNGQLDKSELKSKFDKFGTKQITQQELDAVFQGADVEQKGYIGFSEFVVASMNQNQLINNKNLMALFKKFDKDGNGIIETAEIGEVLKEYGEREYSNEQID